MIENKASDTFKILAIASPNGLRYVKQDFFKRENIELDAAKMRMVDAVLDEKDIEIKINNKSILEYDFVWLQTSQNTKDIAYMLSLYLDKNNIPHTRTDIEITKLVDMFNLAMNNIPIPKIFFCDRRTAISKVLIIQKEIGYPFLIKPTVGLGGIDIFMIRNVVDLINTLPKLSSHKKYIFQKYIQNDFDYRIIVGNGVVLSGEKRIRRKDLFRNNASLGAEEVFLKIENIPDDIKKMAIKVCKVCDLQWSGLDIVTDKDSGKNYVLEMNRCPDLTKSSTEIEAAMTYMKSLRDKTIK